MAHGLRLLQAVGAAVVAHHDGAVRAVGVAKIAAEPTHSQLAERHAREANDGFAGHVVGRGVHLALPAIETIERAYQPMAVGFPLKDVEAHHAHRRRIVDGHREFVKVLESIKSRRRRE